MRGGQYVYIIEVIAKANAEIPPAIVGRAKRVARTRLFDIYDLLPESEAEIKAIVNVLCNLQSHGAIIAYRLEHYHKGKEQS